MVDKVSDEAHEYVFQCSNVTCGKGFGHHDGPCNRCGGSCNIPIISDEDLRGVNFTQKILRKLYELDSIFDTKNSREKGQERSLMRMILHSLGSFLG